MSTEHGELLNKYSIAIVHLRQQLHDKRFGLVLGAGIGSELGFPSWEQLISKIAKRDEVEGAFISNYTSENTITSQLLYQRFKDKYLADDQNGSRNNTYHCYGDIEIRRKWKELVHDVLYQDVPESIEDVIKRSPYLPKLVELIKQSDPMTVTYNFDDTIERVLYTLREKNTSKYEHRGYTVVWDPNVQTEKRPNVIYHPNGYLPKKLSSGAASEQLIFLEDSFEDQLIDSFKGHYNALNNHYSSKTCLFVGISLSDRTLKHMLRMNSKKCFGHIHYIIAYVKDDVDMTTHEFSEYMDSIIKTNFATYNLYTMFLKNNEISTLIELIQMPDLDFAQLCNTKSVAKTRKFFIMGAVAVGKSTTVNQFKSLQTYDEWLEEMPDGMEKSPDLSDEDSIKSIDAWIAGQISLKNHVLGHCTTKGVNQSVSIIDRTPVDAFAFTPDKEWVNKAELILSKLNNNPLIGGKVIFLKGNIPEMMKRAKQKFKEYTLTALKEQQTKFEHLSTGMGKRFPNAINTIDVTDKSIEQVTKEVAEIIFFSSYGEVDFQTIVNSIKEKGHEFHE